MYEKTSFDFAEERASVIKELEDIGGRHLVFVRYSPDHNLHQEWVYNGADIDASKIVWARELSPEEDQKLISYFHKKSNNI